MPRDKKLLVALSLVMILMAAGCSGEAQEDSGGGLMVYASVYPLADFAEKIGGKHVNVILLVPPGVEPHDFEPTPRDLARLSRADVFIYNGIGFEAWIKKAREILDSERTVTVDASASLKPLYSGSGKGRQEADPHVWLDPVRAKKMAEAIRDALIKADPDHAADYRTNFDRLSRRFDELDRTFREIAENAEKREFVVSHSAFGYLADRYGLRQIAISGLSPSDEPGPKELKAVIEAAKRHRVKVIFLRFPRSGEPGRDRQGGSGCRSPGAESPGGVDAAGGEIRGRLFLHHGKKRRKPRQGAGHIDRMRTPALPKAGTTA